MGKILGFIFCIICGIALFVLAMIGDSLYCNKSIGTCSIQSKIGIINYVINSEKFSSDNIIKSECEKMYQPSRSGKKTYFVLKLYRKDIDTPYTIGSFRNYGMCKSKMNEIQKYIESNSEELIYNSELGVSNTLGIMLSILMFVVGYVILTSKEEQKRYDWEDEDSNE